MFDDAALALEEIAPEDKNRTEVLGARVVLYIAAKKWDMAAVVASHLVKLEPENEAWWINLAYAVEAHALGNLEARNDAALDLLPLFPARSQVERYSLRDR
jgi:hypothetical protein